MARDTAGTCLFASRPLGIQGVLMLTEASGGSNRFTARPPPILLHERDRHRIFPELSIVRFDRGNEWEDDSNRTQCDQQWDANNHKTQDQADHEVDELRDNPIDRILP